MLNKITNTIWNMMIIVAIVGTIALMILGGVELVLECL